MDQNQGKKFNLRKPGRPPAWLDRDIFRQVMASHVNTVSMGRWRAISTRDGIVWFRYETLLDIIREASGRHPDVLALAVDREAMNNLVYTTLKALGDNCVIWQMLGKGYAACRCNVIGRAGKIIETTWLTPVRASWLLTLSSWLERSKPYYLLRKILKIELYKWNKNESS